MMRFWTSIALASLCVVARANDTSVSGVSGTVKRMPGKDVAIRMVREDVKVDITDGTYDTVAVFEFHNDSTHSVKTTMGFPESGSGDGREGNSPTHQTGSFESFRTTVDGSPVAARRIVTKEGDESFQAYWVKRVSFRPHQTHRIVVRYRSDIGSVSAGMMRFGAFYDFTGGNWHGSVTESRLSVRFHIPGTTMAIFSFGDNDLPMTPVGSGTYTHTWHNWQAEGEFAVSFTPIRSGWHLASGERVTGFSVNRKNPEFVTFSLPSTGHALKNLDLYPREPDPK